MQDKMNKIHNMDCLEFMKQVPDNYFDVILTDIPYNEVSEKGADRAKYQGQIRKVDKDKADVGNFILDELINEMIRISSDSLVIFCGMLQLSEIHALMIKNKLSNRTIVWEKTNPSPMNSQHLFISGIELAVYGRKSNGYYDGKYCNTVFKTSAGSGKVHPTQKPLELWKNILKKIAKKDMKVFDPFMGSGTTAVACQSLGIEWCGCELEADYVAIANKRLEAVQGSLF